MLLSLHNHATSSGSLHHYRTFLMALFAYGGCLRFAEVSALKFRDISEHALGLRLTLVHSKTDQHKIGHFVQLADTPTVLCPKDCFHTYCARIPSDAQTPNHFVFTNIGSSKPVTRSNCVTLVRSMLSTSGFLNANVITMHSFRIGCATTLIEKGIDSADIRSHGRWRSDSSLDRYLRPSITHKLNISRSLNL